MTAVTKHRDKSQFGEAYTSTSPFHQRRTSGQELKQGKSVGAGADAGPWRRSAAYWPAFIQHQDPPRSDNIRTDWALPHLPVIEKMSKDLLIEPHLWRHFLRGNSVLSDDSSFMRLS